MSTDSREADETYDEGYFHGVNSGYPREGYQHSGHDWTAWLELLRRIQPSGRLLDVGCAYGYLVKAARKTGYRAWGTDISSYAVARDTSLRPWLIRADALRHPFPDDCFEVVTLFDVLEHLTDPERCLEESARVLNTEGVLAATTPDPLYFDRDEPTHCHERPPSYWLEVLRRLGFQVRFRFSGHPYNFQLVAARRGSETAGRLLLFQHDHFTSQADILSSKGPVEAVLRSGWNPRCEQGRNLSGGTASIYLLNPLANPTRLTFRLELRCSPDFSLLRLRLDSSVLGEVHLTSEQETHEIRTPPFTMPRGGHQLFLEVIPGGPEVTCRSIAVESEPAGATSLTQGLPFDLFQRYRLAAELVSRLRPDEVLDVGGVLGDREGHLATTRDFLAASSGEASISVRTTDLRHCDDPHHRPATAWEQPFDDGAFDLVMTLDVLEHLPRERREDFLADLDRVARRWILIGAPFSDPEVEEAERRLAEGLMATREFLQEHRRLVLPKAGEVEDYFARKRGYDVSRFPSGYLPRWIEMQILTQHYFSFRDFRVLQSFSSLYNESCFWKDLRHPSYRILFLISKLPLSPERKSAVEELKNRVRKGQSGATADSVRLEPAKRQEFLELHERAGRLIEEKERALTDVHFLINERHTLVRMQQADIDAQRKDLEVLHQERSRLEGERELLRARIAELESRPLWKIARGRLRRRLRRD